MMRAAYLAGYTEEGSRWVKAMMEYCHENYLLVDRFFRAETPGFRTIRPDGTYILWADCRCLGLDTAEAYQRFFDNSLFICDSGSTYGSEPGFIRINLAAPRADLEKALGYLGRALKTGGFLMDKEEIYRYLYSQAEGIAQMFGSQCETLIQEIVDDVFYIRAIFNGHVSGREVGSTQGILGGTLRVEDLNFQKAFSGANNQLVEHPSGKKIKSSSFTLRGEDYLYVLGINLDITIFDNLKYMLGELTTFEGDLFSTLYREKDNSLESILETCLKVIDGNHEEMKKEDRQILIRLLDEHNFFQIQKSVPFLAGKLGVSKYTIYKDLNKLGAT